MQIRTNISTLATNLLSKDRMKKRNLIVSIASEWSFMFCFGYSKIYRINISIEGNR